MCNPCYILVLLLSSAELLNPCWLRPLCYIIYMFYIVYIL